MPTIDVNILLTISIDNKVYLCAFSSFITNRDIWICTRSISTWHYSPDLSLQAVTGVSRWKIRRDGSTQDAMLS